MIGGTDHGKTTIHNDKHPSFKLLTPDDIEALPDLEWLIDGVLPSSSFGVLYGEPGCGKTFVALSMALALASGRDWLGRKTRQMSVLYLAAEGVLGLKNRLRAQVQRGGFVRENVRFVAEGMAINDPTEVAKLVGALTVEGFVPGLIVIDTLARVAVGVDENSAKDMGQVVAGFEALRTVTDASVLVIHHTRKDGGSERGSSALRGAADVMIECEKGKSASHLAFTLNCAKMKDDEPFKPITATLEKVDLGSGASSLVVGGLTVASLLASPNEDKIAAILRTQFATHGANHGELFDAFVEAGGGSKSTFERALKELKESGRITVATPDKKPRYYPPGVSVTPVSNGYQTPTQGSVMSPPSLGGDTDTKSKN